MPSPRYDGRKVRAALNSLAGRDEHSIMLLADEAVSEHDAGVVASWLRQVAAQATTGLRPDIGAFPQLGLTPTTPADDPRWKTYRRAYEDFHELGQAGRILSPALPQVNVTALQVVVNPRETSVRVNQCVRGVFWASLRPDWLQVGWDLPFDERADSAHLTILECRNGSNPASLVFWDVASSIIRVASDEKLVEMTSKSIGVPQVRANGRRTRRASRRGTSEPRSFWHRMQA
jgi:hypothetical protein